MTNAQTLELAADLIAAVGAQFDGPLRRVLALRAATVRADAALVKCRPDAETPRTEAT